MPFYERTALIERAVHTVTGTLTEEMIIASLAILLILWHFRSALIVLLPCRWPFSGVHLMRCSESFNIMPLSGIAISIGVPVDSSIVMVGDATHHLHQHFGKERVQGDTRELVLPALRTVGRPIFFSVMIMVISFIPVFALGGMEGRMFHPLAWTKTFAMIGVSILAITLVPAIIPLLIRGRLRGEEESWIVRSVIEIYRPVLSYLLEHPWPIVLLTGTIFIVGVVPVGVPAVFFLVLGGGLIACFWAAWVDRPGKGRVIRFTATAASLIVVALVADTRMTRLGREFMPPLDEGTVLDMPITIPRASITQVADDLKARDALLYSFPEVEMVVGKAGRAETPTDPAPPDMIETVVNLRSRDYWPKRELRFDDAYRQTEDVLKALTERGWVKRPSTDQQIELTNDATMFALERFDQALRNMSFQDYARFQHQLAPQVTKRGVEETVRLLRVGGKIRREVSESEIESITTELAPKLGPQLVESPDLPAVTSLAQRTAELLTERGFVQPSPDLLLLAPSLVERLVRDAGEVLGIERETFFSTVLSAIEDERDGLWAQHVKEWNWHLFDRAVPLYTWQAVEQLRKKAESLELWAGSPSQNELNSLQASLEEPFSGRLLLWRKSKDGLLKEMDTVAQVPGWGNIWTQPIINRVDMLATGVRTMIGVKVYGDDLNKIQQISEQIAAVLREVPGAADVFPDQIVGEGYLEIDINRDKAARYGVNVGDVQDVVEVALGGKMITMTVEGRERFPVRIRYARGFRQDEESVKNLLVSAGGAMAAGSMSGSGSMADSADMTGNRAMFANVAKGSDKAAQDPFPAGLHRSR